MPEIINYIISFLLGEQNAALQDRIEYKKHSSASIVIIPSSFFEEGVYMTENSMPQIPLKELDGIPILFGDNRVIRKGKQIVVYADIIASTFFLTSRYEECLNHRDRDQYNRLIGKKSLAYRAGFLMRPVVDEYGILLRSWLRELDILAEEPKEGYKHIYLTHDVDLIWQWDSLYKAIRTGCRKIMKHQGQVLESLKAWIDYERFDPIYTFPWLTVLDQKVKNFVGENKCTCVYFIKGGGSSEYDNLYYQKVNRLKKLVSYLKESGAEIGMHTSFSAGQRPEKIKEEKKRLEEITGEEILWNRNHYLCSKEPEDMEMLIESGIAEDFTMGYADVTGFRLGTSRAVRWINPITRELTALILHPMTIMECTLDSESYMNLNQENAYRIICEMLNTVKKYGGEIVLLWHNTSVKITERGYQRNLYEKTLDTIKSIEFSLE